MNYKNIKIIKILIIKLVLKDGKYDCIAMVLKYNDICNFVMAL